MSVEDIQLTVGDDSYPGRLNVPDEPDGRGVVVLPGGNHGPYGDVFDEFAQVAAGEGIHVFRSGSWDGDRGERKTLAELHTEYDAAVDALVERGCNQVSAVGKSFGGAVALTHVPDDVDRMVLWAPAPRVVDDADSQALLTTRMSELDVIEVDSRTLGDVEVPVMVVYGDEDPIPTDNFDRIVDGLGDVERVVLEGGDHSFEGIEDETVEHTLQFLADDG